MTCKSNDTSNKKYHHHFYSIYILYNIYIYAYEFVQRLQRMVFLFDPVFSRPGMFFSSFGPVSPGPKTRPQPDLISQTLNLVGGFNPFEKYYLVVKMGSSSPNRDEHKKYLSCHHPVNGTGLFMSG